MNEVCEREGGMERLHRETRRIHSLTHRRRVSLLILPLSLSYNLNITVRCFFCVFTVYTGKVLDNDLLRTSVCVLHGCICMRLLFLKGKLTRTAFLFSNWTQMGKMCFGSWQSEPWSCCHDVRHQIHALHVSWMHFTFHSVYMEDDNVYVCPPHWMFCFKVPL